MSKKSIQLPSLNDIQDAQLKKLTNNRKIFFGHQSVGYNILEGIDDIMKQNDKIRLNIAETVEPSDYSSPILGHYRVGKNSDPVSKINAFSGFMENGIGGKADIAFFKFCYVDVKFNTDVENIFKRYKSTLSQLKDSYPGTLFVHFTIPIITRPTGIQASLKSAMNNIIGKPVWGVDDNLKRNEFNEMLRKEYLDKEPLFDLAMIESTSIDGIQTEFLKNDKTFYTLVPEYTFDGGHLNETGRRFVAEQLLIFLARLN